MCCMVNDLADTDCMKNQRGKLALHRTKNDMVTSDNGNCVVTCHGQSVWENLDVSCGPSSTSEIPPCGDC